MTWKVFLGRAGVNSLSMKRPYSGRIWTWSVASGAGAYSHGTPAREDIPHEAVGRLGGRLSAFLVSVMTRRLWHRPPVRLPMHPTLLGLAWRDRYGLLPPDLVSDLHPWTVGGCLRRIRPIRRLAWDGNHAQRPDSTDSGPDEPWLSAAQRSVGANLRGSSMPRWV